MANRNLAAAKAAKNDEFYTQLYDIEQELKHYRKHFAGKTVFCNCDDPFESNFFKYFVLNFNKLKLKKLIATCYAGSPITKEYPIGAYKAVVTQVYDIGGDGAINMEDIKALFAAGKNRLVPLKGDGDFRSEECVELLEEADIVVTNPPFSLFREYVAQLMEHQKKFLIIGNKNAITYKEFFPLLKENKVWIGYGKPSEFSTPNGVTKQVNGLTRWFTNLDIKRLHEELILAKRYSPELYPRYDNYDAINIDKVKEIPYGYDGVMGVPITFMDSYCPEQFEVVGIACGNSWANYRETLEALDFNPNIKYGGGLGSGVLHGKGCYARILIKRK